MSEDRKHAQAFLQKLFPYMRLPEPSRKLDDGDTITTNTMWLIGLLIAYKNELQKLNEQNNTRT